jgi:hypothetical protein
MRAAARQRLRLLATTEHDMRTHRTRKHRNSKQEHIAMQNTNEHIRDRTTLASSSSSHNHTPGTSVITACHSGCSAARPARAPTRPAPARAPVAAAAEHSTAHHQVRLAAARRSRGTSPRSGLRSGTGSSGSGAASRPAVVAAAARRESRAGSGVASAGARAGTSLHLVGAAAVTRSRVSSTTGAEAVVAVRLRHGCWVRSLSRMRVDVSDHPVRYLVRRQGRPRPRSR